MKVYPIGKKTVRSSKTKAGKLKHDNTNNDSAIVSKRMGQAKKFGNFERSSQCP